VKLLRANSRAIAFLQEHPEEADRIIARGFKLESLKAADGSVVPPEAIVAEARKRLGWSAEIEPSDRAFIQRLIDYSVALGFLDKRLNVDDIIDDSFAAKAAAQR